MQARHWHHTIMGIVLLGGLVSAGFAQSSAPAGAAVSRGASSGRYSRGGRGSFGFLASLERNLGLTPEQVDSVRGLLAEQRQQSQALREQTDSKIRAILNADQQKKFDTMLSEQRERRTRRGQSA